MNEIRLNEGFTAYEADTSISGFSDYLSAKNDFILQP